jgi:hypothetical protein
MIKKILIAISLLALIGVGTGIYVWYKPHKKVEDVKGISVTAESLSKEYNANEKEADTKYLNKAIEVSGRIGEIDKNQDGGIMVVLKTGDPMAGVQCAMRDKNVSVATGQDVTIKGFCSGNGITGVSLTDCVIK